MFIHQGTTNGFSIYNCDKLPAKYYSIIAINIELRDDIIKYQGPNKMSKTDNFEFFSCFSYFYEKNFF